jgi:glycine reductase
LKKEVLTLKLELGYIQITDIQFSEECKVENGILYVNAEAVKDFIFKDDDVKACVKAAHFDIAKPGESVRITPVKDVIEPRVKVEGPGGQFPGVIAKVDTVGSGKTHVLRGMAIVTAGKIVGFQEGIIDMSGPGADYTLFSKLLNLVLVCEPVEGVHQHEYEHAVRIAGLRAATFVGELGRNLTPDETAEFETLGIKEGWEKYPNLPRVAYVHMLQSQGLLHDTYVYGVDAKRSLTTIIYPTETMDGAILSGNCVSACDKNTTYHHQNNPVVADLFAQHGKTLNYVCNIITNENVYLADKMRSSDWTAKLCRLLDLDGALVSQEGFGNPDTDLIMNTKKIELAGVKTTIITDEYAGQDGKSQSLADADPLADAVVTGGNANQVIILPKMDKVIGTLDYVDKIAGGHAGSLREDGSIEAELQVITGATNEMGFGTLSAR